MWFKKRKIYPWSNNAPQKKRYIFWMVAIFFSWIYFIFAPLPNPEKHFTICIFKNITGYPCGACGTTRGLKYLFHLWRFRHT